MNEVTTRDLRNHWRRILDRVLRGESLTITRNGEGIAELRPLPRHPLSATTVLRRWRRLPVLDAAKLRGERDEALDLST